MYNLFSVMFLQRSVSNWRGVHLPLVYVHSAICKSYSVEWYYIDLWSSGGVGTLLYVYSSICECYSV